MTVAYLDNKKIENIDDDEITASVLNTPNKNALVKVHTAIYVTS